MSRPFICCFHAWQAGTNLMIECVRSATTFAILRILMTTLVLVSGCGVQSPNQALCTAASEGDLVAMQQLIQRGADVNYALKSNGFTPLHWASQCCQVRAVKFLLEHGANPNARDRTGDPVLISAMGRDECNLEIVELLLDHGADLEVAKVYMATEGISSEIKSAIKRRLAAQP